MEDSIVAKMNHGTKEWLAHAVVGMIWADGRIDPAEIKYLISLLGFLNDKALIQTVQERIRKNDIPPLAPLEVAPDQAIAIMKHLTSISIVDQDLAQAEIDFLKNVAQLLSLPQDITDKFIATAQKRLGGNRFPGILMVGDNTTSVFCFGFTESSCMIFTDRMVNPLARITLKLRSDPADQDCSDYFKPIVAEAQWCRAVKSSIAKYVVKASVKRPISYEEGAHLVYSLPQEQAVNKTFVPEYSSLLGFFVSCRVCGEKDIPFWQLRTRSLHANYNLFGIPCYDKAFGENDFCDFNLYEVSICPKCLFASNQIDYFLRQDKAVGVSLFSVDAFKEKWMQGMAKRKKLIGNDDSWLCAKQRTPEQAIKAYDLAILTHDLLGQIGDDADFANHQRKAVSFILTQAEMLMNRGDRALAEQQLYKVQERLEKAFPNFEREAGIRAAHLIVLINIYFKQYEAIGQYLNYLNNYSRQYSVKPGSKESRTLNLAVRETKEAWQFKDQYAFDALRSFHID